MTDEFVTFRDVETGKTAQYPARFAKRFATLEEIDPSEAGCKDCMVTSVPDTDPDLFVEWDDEVDPQEDED